MKGLKSFEYALAGWRKAWKEQPNLRIHCWVLAVVIGLGFYFRIQAWEWCAVLFTGTLVIGLELVNTAIENLTDIIKPEQDPRAGKVKDISAAAVLVAAIGAVIVGVVIFGKYVGR